MVSDATRIIMCNLRLGQLVAAAFSSLYRFVLANVLSCTAYAVYFDHKRRSDPDFRKALKRESRREARAAKEEAEAQGIQQKQAIENAVREAREEGFPTDVEDKEAYFMNEVGQGEVLCQDRKFSAGIWMKLRMLRPTSRDQAHRGSTLLLQGSQSLSSTPRPYPYLRQDCSKAGHRLARRDDCFRPDDQRRSLWCGRIWLRTWFCDWD